MKLLLYFVILMAVALIPVKGTDVGRLIPVEVIAVSESAGVISVVTDTGDQGSGNTIQEAYGNLKDTAPGIIYLDTAEYLLIEEGIEDTEQMKRYLKGNVRVYKAEEGTPLDGIADYLSVHKSEVRLNRLSDNSQIPIISEENGRYLLIEK